MPGWGGKAGDLGCGELTSLSQHLRQGGPAGTRSLLGRFRLAAALPFCWLWDAPGRVERTEGRAHSPAAQTEIWGLWPQCPTVLQHPNPQNRPTTAWLRPLRRGPRTPGQVTAPLWTSVSPSIKCQELAWSLKGLCSSLLPIAERWGSWTVGRELWPAGSPLP